MQSTEPAQTAQQPRNAPQPAASATPQPTAAQNTTPTPPATPSAAQQPPQTNAPGDSASFVPSLAATAPPSALEDAEDADEAAPAQYVLQPVLPPLPSRVAATPAQAEVPVQYVVATETAPNPTTRLARLRRTIYTIIGTLDIFLALRLLLRLLSANPDAPFTRLLYAITYPFITPFAGVFPDSQANGSVLELSTVLALLLYPLFGWIAVRILRLTNRRQTTPTP